MAVAKQSPSDSRPLSPQTRDRLRTHPLASSSKSKLCTLQIPAAALDRPYVLDFYCPAVKLAVELDGSGHGYRLRETRDQAREEFLARQEIAVVRFWNHQVRKELDSVLQAIWLALEKRAPNNPSPGSSPFEKGRGGL